MEIITKKIKKEFVCVFLLRDLTMDLHKLNDCFLLLNNKYLFKRLMFSVVHTSKEHIKRLEKKIYNIKKEKKETRFFFSYKQSRIFVFS